VTRAKTLDSSIATALAPASIAAAPASTPATPVPAAAVSTPLTASRLTETAAISAVSLASLSRQVSTISATTLIPIEKQPSLPITVLAQKQVGLLTGSASQSAVKPIQWASSGAPDIATIKSILYTP
jgi:hypothetical protein